MLSSCWVDVFLRLPPSSVFCIFSFVPLRDRCLLANNKTEIEKGEEGNLMQFLFVCGFPSEGGTATASDVREYVVSMYRKRAFCVLVYMILPVRYYFKASMAKL